MTEQSPVSIDEVRALVAERHRFDEWLAALDARRAATPEHVYSRVHGDYVARRSQVMTSLHEHVPGLEQHLAELDARANDLGARSQGEEDECAEAMLRHAVGEYDDAKWDEVRTRVEETLATLGTERGSLDAQREDVGSLLDSARPVVPSAPAPEPDVVAEPEPASAAVEAAAVEAASVEVAANHDGAWGEVTTPTAAPVVDTESGTPDWLGAMTPASVPTQSAGEPVAQDTSVVDGIELTSEEPNAPASGHDGGFERPSIWGARESAGRGAASERVESKESVDVFGDATSAGSNANGLVSDAQARREGGAAPADAFDELAFLRSVTDPQSNSAPAAPKAPGTGDAQKTLRCTECGTMNLPTEWYCERCGGELAAF